VDVLEGIKVQDVFDSEHQVTLVPESMRLQEIVQLVAATRQHYYPVVDTAGRLVGIFSSDDVRSYLFNPTIWQLAMARDVMTTPVVAVTPEDDLNTALRHFTSVAVDELPVVDAQEGIRLLGTLRHKEIAAAYHRKLLEHQRILEADSRF
jgi:CIC family chloride channel protein